MEQQERKVGIAMMMMMLMVMMVMMVMMMAMMMMMMEMALNKRQGTQNVSGDSSVDNIDFDDVSSDALGVDAAVWLKSKRREKKRATQDIFGIDGGSII